MLSMSAVRVGTVALCLAILSPSYQVSPTTETQTLEKATFGAGCFWCVEAIFSLVKGVELVESGYSGGHLEFPKYKQVRSGDTGHVEVVRIHFDPKIISYEELLYVLWHTHDPTTLNRQGIDSGPQYRSVIFYHNENQREIAKKSLKQVEESGLWENPIVTAIEPLKNYYKAEDYHQNYFERNPSDGDCKDIITPKVQKFENMYPHLLKSTRNKSEL